MRKKRSLCRSINMRDYLSKEALRVMYYTGRDTVSAAKAHKYRDGVMTKSGDIEISEWRESVRTLIERNGDQKIFQSLINESRLTPWIHSEKEAEQHALERYVSMKDEREEASA